MVNAAPYKIPVHEVTASPQDLLDIPLGELASLHDGADGLHVVRMVKLQRSGHSASLVIVPFIVVEATFNQHEALADCKLLV